jgi:hypothetical protein
LIHQIENSREAEQRRQDLDAERACSINSAYQQYLGRTADPEALQHYVAALRDGLSFSDLIHQIENSREAEQRRQDLDRACSVNSTYQQYLGRAADPETLQHYVAALRNGLSFSDLTREIENSREAEQRRQDLDAERANSAMPKVTGVDVPREVTRDSVIWAYKLMLGREPESESVVTAALSNPSIAELRKAFLESQEFRSRLIPLYAPPQHVECTADDRVLSRLLDRVQKTWIKLGRERPHWSVLANEEFLPKYIEGSESKFYESGKFDLHVLSSILARVNRTPQDFRTLFEFGCGLGRVTPYLAATFERVIACDISSSHLEHARFVIDRSKANNVELTLVQDCEFGMSARFDLWFSTLVLQHNPPPLIAMILRRALFFAESGRACRIPGSNIFN